MLSFFPASWRIGRRLLRSRPYDLVHSVFAIPSAPSGLLLARSARLPHVLSVLGGDVFDPTKRLSPHRTPGLRQAVRWVLRASSAVTAESLDLIERVGSIYGVPDVRRIPLAVRPHPVEPASRSALGLPEDAIVLVTVGRLVARKGLDRLLHILSRLGDQRVFLLVVGDGPLAGSLRELAGSLGIGERVRFEGFVSERRKWAILGASDLFVSTSVHEGFGISFLEAMAAGLPVVAYDCGGQTDFLRSDFARLIPLGNESAFCTAVEDLLANGELRRAMGSAAPKAAADYHPARMAERYLDLYREVLQARVPGSRGDQSLLRPPGARA